MISKTTPSIVTYYDTFAIKDTVYIPSARMRREPDLKPSSKRKVVFICFMCVPET